MSKTALKLGVVRNQVATKENINKLIEFRQAVYAHVYGQPAVNAAADFISGFALQSVQNNLDALAVLAPAPAHRVLARAAPAPVRQPRPGGREELTTLSIPADRHDLRQQIRWLRRLMVSKNYREDKTLLANRLVVLQAIDSPYQDPFQKVSPSRAWKALRIAAILSAAVLAALLGLLYSVSEEALKSLLGEAVSGWIRAHQGAAVALLLVLAVLLALLTWGMERLKKKVE